MSEWKENFSRGIVNRDEHKKNYLNYEGDVTNPKSLFDKYKTVGYGDKGINFKTIGEKMIDAMDKILMKHANR